MGAGTSGSWRFAQSPAPKQNKTGWFDRHGMRHGLPPINHPLSLHSSESPSGIPTTRKVIPYPPPRQVFRVWTIFAPTALVCLMANWKLLSRVFFLGTYAIDRGRLGPPRWRLGVWETDQAHRPWPRAAIHAKLNSNQVFFVEAWCPVGH